MRITALHTHLQPGISSGENGVSQEAQNQGHAALSADVPPIIGVPLVVQQGQQGPLLQADASGVWAIERMGARVLLIPLWPLPTHPQTYQSLWSLMQMVDGFLLPATVERAERFAHEDQSAMHTASSLAWESALAQLATFLGMPLLALADGADLWNRALGGKNREGRTNAAPTTGCAPTVWERHTIRVRASSRLASTLQAALIRQSGEPQPWELDFLAQVGVEHLASGLRSCAQAEDGSLVAFERGDDAFGLGMLGRLDWRLDQVYSTTVFEAFVQACRSFARLRQQQGGWEADRETVCATVQDLVKREQPLLPLPQAEMPPRALALALASSRNLGGQNQVRQRSHLPTKEERVMRQRLKAASR